jgi:hypothetical protein
MSDRGFIMLPRSLLDEPMLQDPVYFRAYVWLLQEAAWKPRNQEVPNGRSTAVVRLDRGQLTHSLTYMAQAWNVTVKRVRTILDRLETASWIAIQRGTQSLKNGSQKGTQTGTLQTVITICNYDASQKYNEDKGTQTGTQTGTQSAKNGHGTYKGIKERGLVAQPEQDASTFSDADWEVRLQHQSSTGEWPRRHWGPRPGEAGCLVPAHLLVKPIDSRA